MKIELSVEDLHIIKQGLESITIQGKDALIVGKLLERVQKSFAKEVEKQNG